MRSICNLRYIHPHRRKDTQWLTDDGKHPHRRKDTQWLTDDGKHPHRRKDTQWLTDDGINNKQHVP